MKRCPSCRKVLPDDAMVLCPYDGTPLLDTQISPNALADTIKVVGNLNDEKARRKYLREQLGEFFSEGDAIRWGILSQQLEAHRKHDSWLKQVEQFLSQEPEFDKSHIARFKAEQLVAIKEFIQELSN